MHLKDIQSSILGFNLHGLRSNLDYFVYFYRKGTNYMIIRISDILIKGLFNFSFFSGGWGGERTRREKE